MSARWHPNYPACVGCGTTVRPYHSTGRCVDCVRGRPAVEAPASAVAGEKFCRGCARWLPLARFAVDRSTKDGRRHRCNRCRRPALAQQRRQWYANHREELAAQRAPFRAAISAGQRRRYREHLDEARAYQRERGRAYRAAHREEINARRRAAYAAKKGAQAA